MDKLPEVRNGWSGLQDVFICVQKMPQIDEKITFCPARYNGAHDERRDKLNLRSIEEIRLGQSYFEHWTVQSHPKFHFVRLFKCAKPGKVYAYLQLMRSHNNLSYWKQYKKDARRLSSSHCRIRIISAHSLWSSYEALKRQTSLWRKISCKSSFLILANFTKCFRLKPGNIDEERHGDHFGSLNDNTWNN